MSRFPLRLLLLFCSATLWTVPARADIHVPVFDHVLIAQVATTALLFMAPRTLEAVPIPQMAAWGLRGLSTIDPRLATELLIDPRGDSTLRLLLAMPDGRQPARSLLTRSVPAASDGAGWGEAVAQISQAAWEVSEPVRRVGTSGLIRFFFDELFNHLDPYSRYAPPSEAEQDRVRRAGRAGVGLTTGLRGGVFVVLGLQPGGPAAQAGVRSGERIDAVDGQSVRGADLASLDALLAGPEGSSVELSLRGRDGRIRNALLPRVRVPPETVTARRVNDMLVLAISSFSRNTGARLAQELILAKTDPALLRGVVLDLRGNRGGVLQQAVASAAMLQASGVVAVTAGRAPDSNHVFLADGRDLAGGLPVVVLVDGNSASAAEILAASLADQRRAVVVGSATLGKGLVQTISELPDGGELLVSWSRVLAPLGWPIQGLGVLPQVCTSLGSEVLSRQMAGLAHGLQSMQAALNRHRSARSAQTPTQILEIRSNCPAAIADAAVGRDVDLATAQVLIGQRDSYAAALLAPPPGPQLAPGLGVSAPAQRAQMSPPLIRRPFVAPGGLTPGSRVSN